MLDWDRIECFEWDEGNSRKSAAKHDVSREEAEQVFLDPLLLVTSDDRHSGAEARYHALGRTIEGRLLFVSFTMRENGTRIRVISARATNRKERAIYAQET